MYTKRKGESESQIHVSIIYTSYIVVEFWTLPCAPNP